MVAEVSEVEPEPARRFHRRPPAAAPPRSCRLPVRREPHDLVLVAVLREPQVLGQRLVEDAERVREVDAPVESHVGTRADAPRRAREVAEPVDRDERPPPERRDEERRRLMREMVLDVLDPALRTRTRAPPLPPARPRARSILRALRSRSRTSAELGPARERVGDLPPEVGARIAIDRDDVEVAERETGLAQAPRDRCSTGKPAQCLMRRNRSSSTAATRRPSTTRRGGGVRVVGVETEDVHLDRRSRMRRERMTSARTRWKV